MHQENLSSPLISWTHPGGSIDGYNIYIGSVKANQALLTTTSFMDDGYAEDDEGHKSLARAIKLPKLRETLSPDARLILRIMNKLQYSISHLGAATVDNIRIKAEVDSKDHLSETFSLVKLPEPKHSRHRERL